MPAQECLVKEEQYWKPDEHSGRKKKKNEVPATKHFLKREIIFPKRLLFWIKNASV